MNKKEYLKVSKESGLPSRCPILEYCDRHAWTIYFYSDYSDISNNHIQALLKENAIPLDFLEKKIRMKSEVPTWSKGRKNGYFSNMCPEVNLFDTENSFGLARGIACSGGVWDTELKNEQFKLTESKHYSECLEFSSYIFEHKFESIQKSSKPKIKHCYTYLMIDHKTGYHKIGMSNNPKYREKTLRSEEPEVEIVEARKFMTRKLAKELENQLHEMYSDKRIRGEWFDLNPKEINEIKQILTE